MPPPAPSSEPKRSRVARLLETDRAPITRREAILWGGLAYCLLTSPQIAEQIAGLIAGAGALALTLLRARI